jgi:hypothetical protein
VREVQEIRPSTGVLRVISPVGSVKDRLAAHYRSGDRRALEKARLVARSNGVCFDEVRRWSAAEGKPGEFERIRKGLLHRRG